MIRSGLLGLMAALSAAGAAAAQTPASAPGSWAFTLGLTTDYVRRGQTRGQEDIEAVGSAEWSRGDVYVGAAANTAAVGDSDYEVDLFVGYQPQWAGWDWDLNAKRVSYFGGSGDVDHWEFYVQATRSIGPLTGVVLVGGSPDYEGASDTAVWSQASAAWVLTPKFGLETAIGMQDEDNGPDYAWWQAGVTWAFTPSVAGDLHWYDTDAAALGESGEGQLAAAVTWGF